MRPSSTLGKHIIQRDPLAKGRACQQCKLRKVRCDGVAPACAACKRTAKFEGRDPELVCCVYNGPKPPSKRAKKPARSARQSSASSTSAGESEADDLLAKMERQIASAFPGSCRSYPSSTSSSPPASASTSHFPIASTSTLPPAIPLAQPTIYATNAFDLPPPSAYLLPPSMPYAANNKAWSDSTATLVDPLALPPYPPMINTHLPVSAPMAPPPAPALPSESNDSYFPHVPSPGSPGSLRSAWSSSSGSSVDSLDSLHTPPNPAPLFGGEFSLPPDPYQSYAPFPGVDASAVDSTGANFYSLPPAPASGLVDGLDGLAGLGLGYTPGGKLPAEQVPNWNVGGDNAWMGLMDPMAGSLWGAAPL